MSRPTLIGVVGLARSGKDTAADYLAERLSLQKYAFAEPLKTMLKSVFGDHFHEGDRSGICPETGVSYRKMMQTLGSEWGRGLNPDIWIHLVERKWRSVGMPYNGMVLSDVRFDSEAFWLTNNRGILLEIRRGSPPSRAWWKFWQRPHVSERGISEGFERYVIYNNGTLEELYSQLDGFINRRVK